MGVRRVVAEWIATSRERWAAHQRDHEQEDKALKLALSELKDRLSEMNELRRQIDQERGRYPTMDVLDARLAGMARENTARMEAVMKDLEKLEDLIKGVQLSASNLAGRLAVGGAIVTFVLSLVVVAANAVLR
jgi:DNA repair exonuclease SbcCD ATPase subunit